MQKTRNKQAWRAWELAGVLALALSFGTALWADRTQEELAEGLVRLHIVANSDTPADQAAKLALRDEILAELAPKLAEAKNREQALDIVQAEIPSIEKKGVSAELRLEHFPRTDYADFSLPEGDYLALRVVMGAGNGHNWWCVLFPPLCTELLAVDTQESFALLPEEQSALVTQADEGYELRFRVVELWEEIAARWG